jgi:hypothetical protein
LPESHIEISRRPHPSRNGIAKSTGTGAIFLLQFRQCFRDFVISHINTRVPRQLTFDQVTFDELLDDSVLVDLFFAKKAANGAFLPHVTQRNDPAIHYGDDFVECFRMKRNWDPEARSQKEKNRDQNFRDAPWNYSLQTILQKYKRTPPGNSSRVRP